MEARLRRRALILAWFSLGYNAVECLASVIAGAMARSPALIGFAFDSLIESLSSGVIVWRFRQYGRVSPEEDERLEARAVQVVGWTFFIVAAYVLYESVEKLYSREAPAPSLLGIIIAAASLVVMPVLSWAKLRAARPLGSASLMADAKQTLACAGLSGALLAGLGLNYLAGLWWADPVAGLVIVAFLVYEGFETLREGHLCGAGCDQHEEEPED